MSHQINSSTLKSQIGSDVFKQCCQFECLENDLSISTIDYSFKNEKVQKTVQELVMERFGKEFEKQFEKSMVRQSKRSTPSSSSGFEEDCESEDVFNDEIKTFSRFKTPKKFRKRSQSTSTNYSYSTETYSHASEDSTVSSSCITDLLSIATETTKPKILCRKRIKSSEYELIKEEILKRHRSIEVIEKIINYEKTIEQFFKDTNGFDVNPDGEFLEGKLQNVEKCIAQITKALNCAPTNESFFERRLDAEKILLLKLLCRDQILKQLKSTNSVPNSYWNVGAVQISSIKLATQCPKHTKVYFFCAIFKDHCILSTEIVKSSTNGRIEFESVIEMEEMAANFEVRIQIFYATFKHKPPLNPDFSAATNQMYFSLWAEAVLTMDDIKSAEKRPFTVAPVEYAPPEQLFSAKVSGSIKLEHLHIAGGFLEVGELQTNGTVFWNQLFCLLNGSVLQFLNHPSDQLFDKAVNVIDFNQCRNAGVRRATREECCRKNVLRLNVDTNVYYLIASQVSDAEYWLNSLELTIATIRAWK